MLRYGLWQDFEEIGITERGVMLRLEKAAKLLPALVIPKGILVS